MAEPPLQEATSLRDNRGRRQSRHEGITAGEIHKQWEKPTACSGAVLGLYRRPSTPTSDCVREQGTRPTKVPLSSAGNSTCWMLPGKTTKLVQTNAGDWQIMPGRKLLEVELFLACPQQSHSVAFRCVNVRGFLSEFKGQDLNEAQGDKLGV